MEAKLWISGVGVGIPRTAFSANLASGAYLLIRPGPNLPATQCFGLVENFTLGSEGNTILYGHAETEWFPVVGDAAQKVLGHGAIKGGELEIKVSGTFIGKGQIDIKVLLIDDDGEAMSLLDKFNIPAVGGQISSTTIRGKVRKMPVPATEQKKAS